MHLKTLIQESSNGKEAAQKLLFHQTSAQLNSVAIRYVVDKSLAQDVLQETYIRIFKNLKQFEYVDENSALAWMKRITATESLRLLKKRKRWNTTDQIHPSDMVTESDAYATDEIMQALLILPPKQRLVFNMYVIEGYSHREIATQLELAESSSRALLTRARTHLQSIISKKKAYEKVS